MYTEKVFHFIAYEDWGKESANTLCGLNCVSNAPMYGSSVIHLVTCKECSDKWHSVHDREQKYCSFCDTPLQNKDRINPNDFFLACNDHKYLAKIETEKFFKENPDYTKWIN